MLRIGFGRNMKWFDLNSIKYSIQILFLTKVVNGWKNNDMDKIATELKYLRLYILYISSWQCGFGQKFNHDLNMIPVKMY